MKPTIILQAKERSNHWPEDYQSIERPIAIKIESIREYDLIKVDISSPDPSHEVNGFHSEQQHYSLKSIDLLEKESQNAINLVYYNKEKDTTITIDSPILIQAIRDLQNEQQIGWVAQTTNAFDGVTKHEMLFDHKSDLDFRATEEEVIEFFKKTEKLSEYAEPYSDKKDTKIEHVLLLPKKYQSVKKTRFIKDQMENYAFNFKQTDKKYLKEKETERLEIFDKAQQNGFFSYQGKISNIQETDNLLKARLYTSKGNYVDFIASGNLKEELKKYQNGQTIKIGIQENDHQKPTKKISFLQMNVKDKTRNTQIER